MNRSVLARQMFAQGGAAVPNEYKGFSKLPEAVQMKMDPVAAKKYAEGGIAGMMPADMPPPPPMPADMPPPMPAADPMPPMGQQAIDPQVLEGLLGEASKSIGNLDEAEDYATVMNSIRGDDATIEERYAELAEVVGPEDAQQTPESVLTLVQPAMVMAAVDQGIGGLAAEEMTQPVQGAMAQGIMSTMAPPEPMPPAAPPMAPPMMGGPPPANFKDGGLVRRGDNQPVKMMAEGGDPLQTAYQTRLPLYQSIIGDPTAGLEEQKELTQAQMLFDVANTALAFAAPMQGEQAGLSAAERLAMAAQQTKLLPTIGARAQQQLDLKKDAEAKDQQMKLGALTAAEADVTAQAKAAADLKKEEVKQAGSIAQIELKDKLNLKTQTALTNLGLDGKLKLAEVSQGYAIDLENLRNTNQLSRDEYNAAKKEELLLVQQDGQRALATLQGQIDFKSRTDLQNQAATISKQLETVKSNLRVQEKGVDLENQLELAGVQQGYQIERMGIGQEQNIALADHNAALSSAAQGRTQAFTAAQAALDRAQKENLQLSDQTFRQLMQEEMQKFTSDQSDIDRAIAQSQRDIENGLAERGMDIKLEQLNLGLASQALDEQYKLGMLAVEQKAAEATKLGTKAKTAQLTYLTDTERLEAYASGTLGDETALFEQTLIDFTQPTYTWTGTSYVKSASPKLASAIQEAIKTRNEGGYPTVTLPGVKITKTVEEDPVTTAAFDSTEFKQSLIKDGAVNFNSPAWDRIPETVIQSGIAYERATGPAEIPTRVARKIAEFGRELFGLEGPTEDQSELTTAERDIINLKEEILQVVNNMSDDRVLKATQDAIRANAEPFTPGIFKFDETAAATLNGLKKQLGRAFAFYADKDPLYNPNSEGLYDEDQVTKYRAKASGVRSVLKDVITLENAYNVYFDAEKGSKTSRTTGRKKTDGGATSQDIISRIAEQNKAQN
jgi:hypothetical protein